MRFMLSIALLAVTAAQAQTTITVPSQKLTLPSQTVNGVTFGPRSLTLGAQTVTLPATATTPPPPPATSTPPSGVTWMYLNGTKTAAADFSGSTTNWFNATSSGYNGGKTDIRVSGGCFIPVWASNYQLPNPGWTYFLISVKPSSSNAIGIHFEPRINGTDADIYPHINLADSSAKYGPAPQAGVWASYKVPFADLGVPPGTPLYKMVGMCDGSTYEIDAIGFQ